ncbi:type IV pilin [Methanofollis ethanolicus]|uniref:type IV pilin n=1 Tax=Methanofollis ethanolicus TaxID=488124 RepID=UPI00082FA8FD|nr:type IV pilin N-terminal domain-containing protein [Methanofollis ethanolicus]
MKKTKGNHETEAVSPVVGVMLMIVVTVIIAAVVSGFAGDMGLDKKTGPDVVLSGPVLDFDSSATPGELIDIKTYAKYDNYPNRPEVWLRDASYVVRLPSTVTDQHGLTFTHRGGDPIDLKDLQMEFSTGDLGIMVDYDSTRVQVQQTEPFEPKYKVGDTFDSPRGPRTVTRMTITYRDRPDDAAPTLDELMEQLKNCPHSGYFVKISPETPDDTIIRTGDQFKIYTDDTTGDNWAIACTNHGHSESMGIESGTGVKWTLSHKPSGQILAQGDLNFPDAEGGGYPI